MASAIASEGTLRDSPLHRRNFGAVRVTFQAYQDGEPAPLLSVRFTTSRMCGSSCMFWDHAEYIRDALAGNSPRPFGVLTNIALTEKASRNAGFGSLVTVTKAEIGRPEKAEGEGVMAYSEKK